MKGIQFLTVLRSALVTGVLRGTWSLALLPGVGCVLASALQ
jgi:hypothetical protein